MLNRFKLEIAGLRMFNVFQHWKLSTVRVHRSKKFARDQRRSRLLLETMECRRLLAGSLSISDVSIEEGDSGTTEFVFTVTRSGDTTGEVTVDYSTEDGTAISESTVFVDHIVDSAADATASVFSADVDSDGDIDLLSAAYFDNTISWYENDGEENFVKHNVTTTLFGAEGVSTADLDGDGDTDILAAAREDDSVTWFENDGNENFTMHSIGAGVSRAREAIAVDLDDDGDMDVLSAAPGSNIIYWYENDGEENFTSHELATGLDQVYSIFPKDLDGDGDIDVVSANTSDDTINWLENDGEQNFSRHIIYTSAFGTDPRAVSTGDFDNDGDIDVVAAIPANSINDRIVWFENDGNESFTLHEISSTTDNSWTVYVIDFDDDGDLDIVSGAAHSNVSPIILHENDGSGSFTGHVVTTERNSPRSVVATDIDGDGDVDIASASHDDDTIAWHENVIDGDFVAQSGSIIFIDGQTEATITILVNGETAIEEHETFFVNLGNPVGGSIDDGEGQGMILNDDFPPVDPEIGVSDSFGSDGDAFVRFSTPLSQYRNGVADSWYVRSGTADSLQHLDITNTGAVPLTLFEIQINAPDVASDVELTASSTDDIVLAPGVTQRIHLTYTPSVPTSGDHQEHDFDETAGIVILSDAGGASAFNVALQGASTFASDINYDGRVNFADLGLFNVSFGLDSQSPGWDPTADITGDGVTNFSDLGVLNVEFGLSIIPDVLEFTTTRFADFANTEDTGNSDWQEVDNAIGDTPADATSVIVDRNDFSDPLYLNYGFDIPDMSVIEGIEVVLITTGSDDPENGVAVSLTRDAATPVGSPATVSGSWSQGSITLGGPTDLWGTTWTAADFNTVQFGLIIEIESGSNGSLFSVYTAEAKITYSDPTSNIGPSNDVAHAPRLQLAAVDSPAETTSLFDDQEHAVAEEIARLSSFHPAPVDESNPATWFDNSEHEAIFAAFGGGEIDSRIDRDWLFDFKNDVLPDLLRFA